MSLTLDAIRGCLEGAIPGVIATVAPDGTPNAAYLSQVHYVDNDRVALTFQFFNKTRENVLANPRAVVQVVDPDTALHYRLHVEYLHTETEGPLFEHMKAKLAGIASHTGMSRVFRLLGADLYRLHAIESVPAAPLVPSAPPRSRLPAVRALVRRLSACGDLAALVDAVLDGIRDGLRMEHSMLLMLDGAGQRLYTVASRGYPASGVGSEIPLGAGVIGVAARERTPIRIAHWTADYAYTQAVRRSLDGTLGANRLETEIPFPGLAQPRSQLAVPILAGETLLGILYAESPDDSRFGYEDEDALVAICDCLGLAVRLVHQASDHGEERLPEQSGPRAPTGCPVVVRRYGANDSVFVGEDYLIKGVAGAIFWKLLCDYTRHSRTDFTNRELRLDPRLGLPDIGDNLEARLILLQRRLAERCDFLGIEKTGRGRFRLRVERALELEEVAAGR